MKEKIKSNSGFTLIELIIAMAILAFLMTAVVSFMTSGLMTFKKAKSDITVHNSAQETYDQMLDTLMSANDLVVCAYRLSSAGSVEFGRAGEDLTETLAGSEPVYYVRDSVQETAFKKTTLYAKEPHPIKYFKSLNKSDKLYVRMIVADTSVPLDANNVSLGENTNALVGGTVDIAVVKRTLANGVVEEVKDTNGRTQLGYKTVDADGNDVVVSLADTARVAFVFDDEKMYCMTKYAYQTSLDDYYAGTGDKLDNYLYTKSLNYKKIPAAVNPDTDSITGCVMNVDPTSNSFSVELKFSDKNMTYTSKGMAKIRNSFVLKAKETK